MKQEVRAEDRAPYSWNEAVRRQWKTATTASVQRLRELSRLPTLILGDEGSIMSTTKYQRSFETLQVTGKRLGRRFQRQVLRSRQEQATRASGESQQDQHYFHLAYESGRHQPSERDKRVTHDLEDVSNFTDHLTWDKEVPIQNKGHNANSLMQFNRAVVVTPRQRVHRLRGDNGGAYIGNGVNTAAIPNQIGVTKLTLADRNGHVRGKQLGSTPNVCGANWS